MCRPSRCHCRPSLILSCHLPQHTELEARINELVEGSVEDVLMLARWAGTG